MTRLSSTPVAASGRCDFAPGESFGKLVITPVQGRQDVCVNAWDIKLGLAGGITDPLLLFFKMIMQIFWSIYQLAIVILAWIADLVMSLSWLHWFHGLMSSFEESIAQILRTFDLYATMLLVSGFICAMWMLWGRWGQGLLQLFIALVIANYALASVYHVDGIGPEWSSPVDALADEDVGVLYQARDGAVEIVGSLTDDRTLDDDPDVDEPATTTPGQSIIEGFLYYPAMLINFGEALSKRCQTEYVMTLDAAGRGVPKPAWQESIASGNAEKLDSPLTEQGLWSNDPNSDVWLSMFAGTVRYDPDLWSVVGKCEYDNESTYFEAAGPDALMAQLALTPAATLLGILVLFICGVAFFAGINAMIQGIRLLFSLLAAILPGEPRGVLWRNIATLATSVMMLFFAIVFLGTALYAITQFMIGDTVAAASDVVSDSSADETWVSASRNPARWALIGKFVVVDLLIVAAIFAFFRSRKQLAEARKKFAAALARKLDAGTGKGATFGQSTGSHLAHVGSRVHLAADVQRDATGGRHIHSLMRRQGGNGSGTAGGVRRSLGATAHPARSVVRGAIGHAALALGTGGGSLAVKGGLAAAKGSPRAAVHAGRGALGVGRLAGASATFASRHTRLGNALHRAGLNARMASRAVGHPARSGVSRAAGFARLHTARAGSQNLARLTGGRLGAGRANQRPAEQSRIVQQNVQRQAALRARHDAAQRADVAREAALARRYRRHRAVRQVERDTWRRNNV